MEERTKWRMETNIFSLLCPDNQLEKVTNEVKKMCDDFVTSFKQIGQKYPESAITDTACREQIFGYLYDKILERLDER